MCMDLRVCIYAATPLPASVCASSGDEILVLIANAKRPCVDPENFVRGDQLSRLIIFF